MSAGLRLAHRPLTLADKPRVIISLAGRLFWVEKMTEHGPIVETKHNFQDAIKLASWWGAIRNEAAK